MRDPTLSVHRRGIRFCRPPRTWTHTLTVTGRLTYPHKYEARPNGEHNHGSRDVWLGACVCQEGDCCCGEQNQTKKTISHDVCLSGCWFVCIPSVWLAMHKKCIVVNENVCIHFLRSGPPFATHHRRCGSSSIIVGSLVPFWAQTISFLFWSDIAKLYGASELSIKFPG